MATLSRCLADTNTPPASIRLESTAKVLGKIWPEDRVIAMVVSPDAGRLALAKYPGDELSEFRGLTDEPVLIIDGEEHSRFSQLYPGCFVFSPDSKRLAFAAASFELELDFNGFLRKSSAVNVWIDMEPQRLKLTNTGRLHFSPDGKRIAYATKTPEGWRLVIDGQLGSPYEELLESADGFITFSSDSRHYGYLAARDGGQLLVVDGREYGPYDSISCLPEFSADGQRFACVVESGQRQRVLESGREGPPKSATFQAPASARMD